MLVGGFPKLIPLKLFIDACNVVNDFARNEKSYFFKGTFLQIYRQKSLIIFIYIVRQNFRKDKILNFKVVAYDIYSPRLHVSNTMFR